MTAGKCYITNGWLYGPIRITHHQSPNYNGGMSIPGDVLGVVMHTMVGDLPGCDGEFMNSAAEVSAHFGIDQEGNVIQWVPVNGGVAWAECGGNGTHYSIEHADHGDPHNPITPAQATASAQIVECLSRYGNFPLDVANTIPSEGYNKHNTGGASWCGHSCPDYPYPGAPFARSTQRQAILNEAAAIRAGKPVPPQPPTPPAPIPLPTSLLLVEGDTGSAVDYLQELLNAHAVSAQLTVDGQFGPDTLAAVKAFQAHVHITVDGQVGPQTWKNLTTPHELDPGVEIMPNYYRHYGNGHVSPNQYAAKRGEGWASIVAYSSVHGHSPETSEALARLVAFTNQANSGTKAIPTNVVFYTKNP